MAKIELKGIVKSVSQIENIGKDSATRKQSLILFVPGYHDEFGDQKGKDEEWRLDVFNKKIDDLNLNSNVIDKRVRCIIYLNSQRVEGKEPNAPEMYFINANLSDMKVVDGNSTTASNNIPAKKEW